jgi:hypothetical protein
MTARATALGIAWHPEVLFGEVFSTARQHLERLEPVGGSVRGVRPGAPAPLAPCASASWPTYRTSLFADPVGGLLPGARYRS